MRRMIVTMIAALTLSGCAASGGIAPGRAPMVPIPTGTMGLERVMGQTAAALVALFGTASADIREGSARKLQFENATCVLDTYLYPKGKGDPVVTYVDARQSDGSPIDRASCVGALALKHGR